MSSGCCSSSQLILMMIVSLKIVVLSLKFVEWLPGVQNDSLVYSPPFSRYFTSRLPSGEYTGESTRNTNNSTNLLLDSKSSPFISNGTRRSCLMKKTRGKKSRDTVPLSWKKTSIFLNFYKNIVIIRPPFLETSGMRCFLVQDCAHHGFSLSICWHHIFACIGVLSWFQSYWRSIPSLLKSGM